ncbi:MAG: hypothetical protein KI785_04460 [Devosiaceae bacterium]|nr:hypothetical protein [Devosiaceae bacterium MH13]
MSNTRDPFSEYGVRELARRAGISPTTASRLKRGEAVSAFVGKKVQHLSSTCLCCGAPKNYDPELLAGYEAKITELIGERDRMARTIARLVEEAS